MTASPPPGAPPSKRVNQTFSIRHARTSEAGELHEFLFGQRKDNLRWRTEESVAALIKTSAFYLVTRAPDHSPTGCCFLEETLDNGAPAVEFGGVWVDTPYRGKGLFRLLAQATIGCYYITEYESATKPMPLVAHVARGNEYPRKTMEYLGFTIRDRDQGYDPAGIPGLEHLPVAEDGKVYGDLYTFDPANFVGVLSALVAHDATGFVRGRDSEKSKVTIEIPVLKPKTVAAVLARITSTDNGGYLR